MLLNSRNIRIKKLTRFCSLKDPKTYNKESNLHKAVVLAIARMILTFCIMKQVVKVIFQLQ